MTRAIPGYGVAVVAVGLASLLTTALWPHTSRAVTAPFFAAVMMGAWAGGLGSGLLATILSVLSIEYFFEPPFHSILIGVGDLVRIGAFMSVAALISALNSHRRHAEDALRLAQQDLDRRVKERTAQLLLVTERLEQQVAECRRAEETAWALADVERELATTIDPVRATNLIVTTVLRLFRVKHSGLHRLDPASGALVCVAVTGVSNPEVWIGGELPPGTGLSARAIAEGKPVCSPDVLADSVIILPPWLQERLRETDYRARAAAPLIAGGVLVGTLTLGDAVGRRFTADELELLAAFAAQAAAVLQNGQLLREAQQACEELTRTQDQLVQAQKMEAVGRLAGGIAHDFNNVLTVIRGRSQLLLKRFPPDDPARRDLDLIDTAAGRAAALTQQLLAFSRKQILQPKGLDLNAVVADFAPMLRRLIGEDLELVVRPDPEGCRVKADPAQLEQVIMNLAVNARDAMPKGGTLTIATANVELDKAFARRHPGAHAGPHATLSVSDTGIGMDKATLSHLFEPFFTTKAPGKGTGLGLATVYGIVKQHGGYIAVDSRPGEGSRFRVYLPQVEAALDEPVAEGGQAAPPRGAETILLVEDDEGVREVAHEILETSGYTVLEAPDGQTALRIAEAHPGPLHLLVTDVVMPQMSGRELAQRLTAAHPGMKVLYMTGYTDDAVIHHGVLEQGMPLLRKPFMPDALRGAVGDVLRAPSSVAS